MNADDWIMIGVAVVLTIIAMLLVAAEAAIGSISKSRAQRMVDEGQRGAARVAEIVQDPAPVINASRFLRVLSEIMATVLVTVQAVERFERTWQQLLFAGGVMVVVAFILWGVAPQTLGLQRAERIARRSARPLSILQSVLGPLPAILIVIGNVVTPGRGFADGPFGSEAELRELVDMAEASDLIESDERQMIHSVFELGDTIVREIMVPRTEVVYIEGDKTLRQALSLALRSGFSRIPVVSDSLDDVIGVVYVKDVMKRIYDNPDSEKREPVSHLMRTPSFCPDSKPADEVLREMQRTRNHIVMVVDEFGGTAGLMTIEDIVEEIVGEITDEYDAEPDLAQEVEPGRWRISARMPVDELGDLFEMELTDDDVDTVGGLLAKGLNMVPIEGSRVVWNGIEILAEKATRRRHRIDTVLVRLVGDEPDVDEGDEGAPA